MSVDSRFWDYFLTLMGKNKSLESSCCLHIDAYNLTTFNKTALVQSM